MASSIAVIQCVQKKAKIFAHGNKEKIFCGISNSVGGVFYFFGSGLIIHEYRLNTIFEKFK